MSAIDQQVLEPIFEPLIELNNPEKTFFKEIFYNYANFGTVSKSLSVTLGDLSFGSVKEFRIPSGGDLLTKMYLNVTLPAVHTNIVTGSTYANWVNNVGHALVSNLELCVSNTKVDSHSGVFLDIWNELTDENKKEWRSIGKFEDILELKTFQTNQTTYRIPLKFFFNRNNGVALPLFVLGEDTVKIKVAVNSLANLLKFDGGGAITDRNIVSFELGYDVVILSNTEKEAIRRNIPSEMLIETVQSFENLTSFNNLSVENPVKELMFVFQKNARKASANPQITLNKSTAKGNDIFNYSGTSTANSLDYDAINTAYIKWGVNDITEGAEPAKFFREEQVQKYHSRNSDKNIYVYSFDIKPEDYKPSGYFNFSRDISKYLSFTFGGLEADTTLNVYALTYEYLFVQDGRGDKRDVPIEGAT